MEWSPRKEFGGTTDVALATASFGNKLYLFSKGIDDKKVYISSSSNGNNWSSWKETNISIQEIAPLIGIDPSNWAFLLLNSILSTLETIQAVHLIHTQSQ